MKYKTRIRLLLITVVAFVLINCGKDWNICTQYTEVTNQNHLVDISLLNKAPELLDTLAKYPQLQVSRVIDDPYAIIMHCNVFYKGLENFSRGYEVIKGKRDGEISTLGSIIDTFDVSLTPKISFEHAIRIARENMDFGKLCLSYQLGLFDSNSVTILDEPNYVLVWRITNTNGYYPVVLLDAACGEVYYKDNGMRE
jgi:hypothetical protein